MSTPTAELEPIPAPEEAPSRSLPPGEWIRENLFYSPSGTAMTLLFSLIVCWAVIKVARFVFVSADWEIVRRNLTLFITGLFPRAEFPRLWVAVYAGVFLLAVLAGTRGRSDADARAWARRWWPLLLALLLTAGLVRTLLPLLAASGAAAAIVAGRLVGRTPMMRRKGIAAVVAVAALIVPWQILSFADAGFERWGGLLLTLGLAVAGIGLSFPLGIMLALGRRSTLPAVRVVSIAYIELFRGVPLVTVLFMGDLLLGFFLPPGSAKPGAVTRALIALVAFTCAYLAEIVRGGLLSVPRGQTEAAYALGLSRTRTTAFIVLPQALRAVIPAVVGQFISLFKDTSLVATIGLLELFAVAQTVTKQPDFLGRGLHAETLTFVSFIYWAGAYSMSRASQRLERRLGVGER